MLVNTGAVTESHQIVRAGFQDAPGRKEGVCGGEERVRRGWGEKRGWGRERREYTKVEGN